MKDIDGVYIRVVSEWNLFLKKGEFDVEIKAKYIINLKTKEPKKNHNAKQQKHHIDYKARRKTYLANNIEELTIQTP